MNHTSITYLDVLTAQQSLLQAELSQAQDRFERIQRVISLYYALGGGTYSLPAQPKKRILRIFRRIRFLSLIVRLSN